MTAVCQQARVVAASPTRRKTTGSAKSSITTALDGDLGPGSMVFDHVDGSSIEGKNVGN
jgi:hypothetical protein